MKKTLLALSLAVISLSSCCQATKTAEKPAEVRNVIFMIGDGMGLAQASMAMVENGYDSIAFDRAENIALIKTYSHNNRVTDSAAAGTALACGEKTNNGMLGMTADLDTCLSMSAKASKKGKATGLVASCTLQHATPAAFYAHVESRNSYEAIAVQLANSTIDLAIGGGESYFNQEIDGEKLIDQLPSKGYAVARNFDELAAVADTARVLGLFEQGHPKSMADGRGDYLPKATAAALDRLSKNENGFLLMVEGSQIDWTCHGNDAEGTLAEVKDFNDCVNIVMDFADKNPGTLVVVTADHETGGLAMISGDADFSKADSGVNYTYATKGHSGILVPVYLYGTGADQINGIMENTQLSKEIVKILGLE